MADLTGRVAFITGAARGQGRAHAVRLARDGADILGIDICQDIESLDIPNASLEDLAETKRLVEAEGRRMIARQADVRDFAAVSEAVDEAVAEFGRLDIVIANAGVVRLGTEDDGLAEWNDIIGVNLTGVFHTCRASIAPMIAGGRGGSIVITSSTAGIRGAHSAVAGGLAYTAAKRGVVGLMQVLANDLAQHWIRVNTIHPTGVATKMLFNDAMRKLFKSGHMSVARMQNALPIEVLQPEDIAGAVAWLVSDEARFITGVQMPLDAGFTIR
jgi:SDR family mycofactocin-dependent oxidoreductase